MALKTPHDTLFKATFSKEADAIPQLRAVLPPAILERIELSTLKLAPGSFVDEVLKSSYSDLLYTVKLSGDQALIYVLFEHQSGENKLVRLRMLRYIVRILERYAAPTGENEAPQLPLPLVLPVLLHHVESGWSATCELEDMFQPQLVSDLELRPFIPRLRFVLDDITQLDDEAIRLRGLARRAALALWALRDARVWERLKLSLAAWAPELEELMRTAAGREAGLTIIYYITQVSGTTTEQFANALARLNVPEIERAIMTLAEQFRAEGQAKGEAKGRAEGEAKVLLRQLTLKFGELSDATRTRVAQASEDELARWTDRILTAASLDQVFEDGQ